jgi:nucleoid-associated protein YgaU
MRKDVKVGLAVGVILFAVIVVYLLVVSGSGKDKKSRLPVATKSPPAAADSSNDAGKLAEVTPSNTTADPVPPTGVTPPPPANNTGWNWGEALAMGRDVPPAISHTPGTENRASVAGADVPEHRAEAAPLARVDVAPARRDVVDPTPVRETETPAHPSTRPAQRTHRVQSGEYFWTIARAAYGNAAYADLIAKANPGVNPKALRPGQVIVLPEITAAPQNIGAEARATAHAPSTRPVDAAREYRVGQGDTLYAIAKKLYGRGDRADKIYELNKQWIGADPNRLKLGMVLQLPEPPTQASR